jgi:hypothetical protein
MEIIKYVYEHLWETIVIIFAITWSINAIIDRDN